MQISSERLHPDPRANGSSNLTKRTGWMWKARLRGKNQTLRNVS